MHFIAPKLSLLTAVRDAAKAASKNGVEQALMNVLLTLEDNTLTVTGTDNQIAIRETMTVEGKRSGSVAILADLLCDTLDGVQTSKSDSAELVVGTDYRVTLTSGSSVSYNLNARSHEAFPLIAPVEEANSLVVSGTLLREISKKMQMVASASPGGLNTYDEVLVEGAKGIFTICATDSVRLAFLDMPRESTGLEFLGEFKVLIPSKVIKTVAGLVRPDDKVEIKFTASEAVFRFRHTEMRGRLSDRTFPNFRTIMPKSQAINAVIPTASFVDALKGVMVTAKDSKNKVFVDFTADLITVSSTSPELGESKRSIEAVVDGKDIRLAFNAKYLLDFLGVAEHDTIKWGVTSSSFPAEMTPDLEGNGYRYIVMPITHH